MFLVESFLCNFYWHLETFTGHTGHLKSEVSVGFYFVSVTNIVAPNLPLFFKTLKVLQKKVLKYWSLVVAIPGVVLLVIAIARVAFWR